MNLKILTFFLLVLSFKAYTQTKYQWGIAGGVNAAKLIHSDENTKPINGFHVGLIGEARYSDKFGIKTQLFSSSKGTLIKQSSTSKDEDKELKLTYIDWSLLANFYTFKIFSFQLGIQPSVLINAEYDGKSIKNDLNLFDIGLVGGIGMDVFIFNTAIRYNYGITEVDKNSGVNSVLQVTIGLWY